MKNGIISFKLLLSWHFWEMYWPPDKLEPKDVTLQRRSMRFFPGRPQGQHERPVSGPVPEVEFQKAPWAVGALLAVYTHWATVTWGHSSAGRHLGKEGRGPHPPTRASKGSLGKFVAMVTVVVTVTRVGGPLPLLGILGRWAKRWRSCPPDEGRPCGPQPHSAISSTVHPRRVNHLLSYSPQDLDLQLDTSSPPGSKIWK